jgi:putative MATE family efflux protein
MADLDLPPEAPTPRAGQRDLTTGPVTKTLFLFALPSLGVNILQSMNGSVNAIWIGRFLGEKALAATSNATMVMFLMFATLFGFAMSTTILIGQAAGRRDMDGVRRTLGAAMGMFIIAGITTATLGWIFAPNLLHLLATPPDAYPLALSYLRVIFLGMPFTFVAILLASALRGVGDSVTPLWNTILNVALDAGLNPVFILGLGPIPAMGIAGSALATLIAGLVSITFLFIKIYRKDLPIRLRGAELGYLRPHRDLAMPILAKGFPMGLSMIVMAGSSLVMIGLINREGVDTTAAFGVMNQLWSYVQMPAVAVGSAVSAMAAQNIGAGKWDRLDRVTWAGMGINFAMTATLLLAITLAVAPLMRLFLAGDSRAIPIGEHMNLIVGWSSIFMGMSMVLVSVVRANGAVIMPLIFLIISAIGIRFAVGFAFHPRFGADAIWWAFSIGATSSFLMSLGYYWHGGWRKSRMVVPVDVAEMVG